MRSTIYLYYECKIHRLSQSNRAWCLKIPRNVSFAFNQPRIRVSEGSTSNVLPGNFASKKVRDREPKQFSFQRSVTTEKKGRKKPLGPRKKSCSSQNRQDTTTVGAKACGAEHREKTKDTKVNLCWRKLEKLPGGVSRRHSPLSAKSRTERARLHRALHGVYSFITCVFGIVLRSADYSRCTETRPRYFLRVSEFFSDSDKILAAASTAALGALEAEPGKPANVE